MRKQYFLLSHGESRVEKILGAADAGEEQRTIDVLHFGYHIPFHHLPPMTWEPIGFVLCGLGSMKVQTLQIERDSMLLKDSLEIVYNRIPACSSRLLLVEKVFSKWRPIIDLLPLNTVIIYSKFKMETVALVLAFFRETYCIS